MNPPPIHYTLSDLASLDEIAPLWRQLNAQHAALSPHFADHFRANTFEKRMQSIREKSQTGPIRLEIARTSDHAPIGYCLSSITADTAEIDSLFVLESHRGTGIGSTLVQRALDWFAENHIAKITLTVGYGNERVLPFYQRFGLYPRALLLQNR